MVMWCILRMLLRFTHQVAVSLSLAEMTHCPDQTLRLDFNPSTALLAWINSSVIFLFVPYGKSWCVGLFSAIFSEKKYIYEKRFLFHFVLVYLLFLLNAFFKTFFYKFVDVIISRKRLAIWYFSLSHLSKMFHAFANVTVFRKVLAIRPISGATSSRM